MNERQGFVIAKGYIPGAIGRITLLHADYYHRQVGFGLYFETKIASGLSEFLQRYDETRDGIWFALVNGQIEGSIVIDGAHAAEQGASLRWFIISDALRGKGAGNALMAAAIDFCRARNYSRTTLRTIAQLHAARHLYEKFGFRLTERQPSTRYGGEVEELVYELR